MARYSAMPTSTAMVLASGDKVAPHDWLTTLVVLMATCLCIHWFLKTLSGYHIVRSPPRFQDQGIQTDLGEGLTVKIEELTQEALRRRLDAKDLSTGGDKEEQLERLMERVKW